MSNYALMPFRRCNMSVGLLGGSFNPPHHGHYHVSQQAQKRLRLKRSYWLVSPQNPLKEKEMSNTLVSRLEKTQQLISAKNHGYGAIRASKIEEGFKTCYTASTIARLKSMHPETNFIWLMGADNLGQIHRWYRWRDIIRNSHVCVIDRTIDDHKILGRKIASLYPQYTITNTVTQKQPLPGSWSFFKIRKVPISSSALRMAKLPLNHQLISS